MFSAGGAAAKATFWQRSWQLVLLSLKIAPNRRRYETMTVQIVPSKWHHLGRWWFVWWRLRKWVLLQYSHCMTDEENGNSYLPRFVAKKEDWKLKVPFCEPLLCFTCWVICHDSDFSENFITSHSTEAILQWRSKIHSSSSLVNYRFYNNQPCSCLSYTLQRIHEQKLLFGVKYRSVFITL